MRLKLKYKVQSNELKHNKIIRNKNDKPKTSKPREQDKPNGGKSESTTSNRPYITIRDETRKTRTNKN